jgi:hypothetical protein
MPVTLVEAFKDPGPLSIPAGQGLWLNPSRLTAPVGSLTGVRNWEVVNGAYEESQGLTIVGPTLSEGLDDFWHAAVDVSDCITTGTLVQGDLLYWYANDGVTVAGSGRMYYVEIGVSTLYITLDKVAGISPRRATSFYTSNGATIQYTGSSDFFIYQSRLGLSWADYKGPRFLGALSTAQREADATWDQFKPDPLGVQGISGVFQYRDSTYAVRDFFGGRFEDGAEEPSIGDEVEVDYGSADGTFTALVAGYELTDGSWEGGDAEGYLYLYPSSSTTLEMSYVDNWDVSTTITNNTTGNTLGSTLADGNRQYQNKGLLWKRDVNDRQGGWKYVDLGYSLSFRAGKVAPKAANAPLITSDAVDSVTDTGFIDFFSPATQYPTTGTYSAWTNLGNVTSGTPGSYASTTVLANDKSRFMSLQINGSQIPGNYKVLGLEVRVTAHCTTAGSHVVINKVQLRNESGSGQYLSSNRGDRDFLTNTPGTQYVYGGQLDTWELDVIDPDVLQDDNYYVDIQFEDVSGASKVVNVDEVLVKVHYAVTGQQVYFYDGSGDVNEAFLYAYQVFDGDWSTDDAEGWMTIQLPTGSPSASLIIPGLEIRTGAGGTGDLIAYTRTVSKNLLPSTEEMESANAIYQSRVATFSGDDDAATLYAATGASPAFMLDKDDRFSFIRLPIDRDKDKPRYVEFHRNHLLLALNTHFMASSIGAPNNFNTYDGATSWNPKDTITGLAAAANGTTMVVCEDSIHGFAGSAASGQDPFNLKIVTDNSGALPYTITNLLGNVFVDYAGITTADISDKFGGFEIGRRSAHIRTLLRRLLGSNALDIIAGNRIVAAIPVRKKNQYRVYLANGEIIVATFPDDPSQPLQFTRQNYTAYQEGGQRGYEATFAPTAIDSSVLSNGDESIVMGTQLGHVMRIDPKYMDVLSYADKRTDQPERRDTLSTWKFFKYLDFNPLHAPDPSALVDYKSLELYLEHAGYTRLNHLSGKNYDKFTEVPDPDNPDTCIGNTTTVGEFSDFPGTLVDDYMTWYINTRTDGLAIRLSKFGGDGAVPTRINNLLFHAEVKADRRNRIDEDRDYAVDEGIVPEDILVVGATGTAVATGNTGTVTMNMVFNGTTATATAAGNTGTVTLAPDIWTFDQTDITFDETSPTWDGSDP